MLFQLSLTSILSFVGRSRSGSETGTRRNAETIDGPLMFHYLLNMLQQPGHNGPTAGVFRGMMPPGGETGRMGDYVFSQDGKHPSYVLLLHEHRFTLQLIKLSTKSSPRSWRIRRHILRPSQKRYWKSCHERSWKKDVRCIFRKWPSIPH